jgi:hypothetical protein
MKRHKTKHTRRAAENAQPLVMPDTMLPQRVQALPHRTSALPQAAPRAIYAQYAAGGTHYEPPQICKLHCAYLNMWQKYRHWRAER